MADPDPGANVQSRVYADVDAAVHAIVVPSIITQSDEIATYFAEDLEEFVRLTHTDLANAFQVPTDYPQGTKDIINMLYEDIAHMLRDGLIIGIHLLLSDNVMDPGANAYIVRYHAHYMINNPNNAFSSASAKGRFGGLLAPPKDVWRNSLFALLIDWSPTAKNRRYHVQRPDYCFDWVTQEKQFDATNVVHFRDGEMAVDSASVKRYESLPPEYQRNI
jgi:hypothetical protein